MSTMARTEIEQFAREYDQAWNEQDPDAIAARHAEDGTYRLHVAGSPAIQGRDALRAAFQATIDAWREVSFRLDRVLYGSDFYVWQSTLEGVLDRPLEFGVMTIPANGKRLEMVGLDVIVLDDDGLIQSKETHFDLVAAAIQAAQA